MTEPTLELTPAPLIRAWCWALGRELHRAVRENDMGELRRLLERGAQPDTPDARGRTPLHLAAELGRERALVLLLRHGADPTRPDHLGVTPVDTARMYWHLPLVDTMLERIGA